MPHYFYVIPATRFTEEIQPALAQAWNRKSFEPCRPLCERLAPAAEGFARSHRIDPDAMFIEHVAAGMSFSKDAWRALVSDLLMVSASMMPEIQTSAETLRCLLSPTRQARADSLPSLGASGSRKDFTPTDQAHFGTRDLCFGGGFYRPEQAGWNDAADVARLSDYLACIDPRVWKPEQLTPLADIAEEDRGEELEFARQCLQNLTILYQSARNGHVIVCEAM